MISFWPFELKVKASVGQGVWAAVPWLAFFDPLITETATKGFYVVILINPQDETIILSMNQGTTEIYNEFKTKRGKSVLRRRAKDMSDRIPEYIQGFSEDTISLGSDAALPEGYVAGHSFGKTYKAEELTEEQLSNDIYKMLEAYEVLVNRGGTTPSDVMHEQAESMDVEETRKYIISRRIERSPSVRKKVLQSKSLKCESCGLDPELDYGYRGKPEHTPLDVHHAVPLRGLSEGETRRYRIPDDFLILCPSCHRVIHKQDDPSDLGKLKSSLRFKIAREVGIDQY
ncbi:MAG: DUF3578 domain-containing protein [Rhodobacteraceae bacterium]|nr:DUF3578 domain-containing protein [Paracoccaceae bacterium]